MNALMYSIMILQDRVHPYHIGKIGIVMDISFDDTIPMYKLQFDKTHWRWLTEHQMAPVIGPQLPLWKLRLEGLIDVHII